ISRMAIRLDVQGALSPSPRGKEGFCRSVELRREGGDGVVDEGAAGLGVETLGDDAAGGADGEVDRDRADLAERLRFLLGDLLLGLPGAALERFLELTRRALAVALGLGPRLGDDAFGLAQGVALLALVFGKGALGVLAQLLCLVELALD